MARENLDDAPRLLTLAEGFYVRQAVDNIAWIDMGEYALVVDALEQRELEEEIFAAIRSTLGDKPVRFVLNTHTHYDHVALNEAFQRRMGAQIINQEVSPLAPAGRWFEGSRRKLCMLPMPGCHTEEDCIVWAPGEKALFVGDIFGYGLVPLIRNLTDETAQLLLDTYGRLIEYGTVTVIPGHGPLCTTDTLRRWVDYFRTLGRRVCEACAAGKSDEQILADNPPPADMKSWWRFLLWKHEDTRAKVLKAVRRGKLTLDGVWAKPA